MGDTSDIIRVSFWLRRPDTEILTTEIEMKISEMSTQIEKAITGFFPELCGPEKRSIKITVSPPEAIIHLSGEYADRGQVSLSVMPAVEYSVRISAEGYETIEKNFKAGSENIVMDTVLEASVEKGIMLTSTPSGAGVYRSGNFIGMTPMKIEDLQNLTLRKPGYLDRDIEKPGDYNIKQSDKSLNIALPADGQPASGEGRCLWGVLTCYNAFIGSAVISLGSLGTAVYLQTEKGRRRDQLALSVSGTNQSLWTDTDRNLTNEYNAYGKRTDTYSSVLFGSSAFFIFASIYFYLNYQQAITTSNHVSKSVIFGWSSSAEFSMASVSFRF